MNRPDPLQFKPWVLVDAIRAFDMLRPLFQYQGWLLAMYGSVLSGIRPYPPTAAALQLDLQTPRKDLDLMAVPFVPQALPPNSVVTMLVRDMCYERQADPYYGIMDTEAIWLSTPGNQLIDLQFREVSGRK